jgi:biotin--protein ligase
VKILIYSDEGADQSGLLSLHAALKQEQLDQAYSIESADRALLRRRGWNRKTRLLIFPGGRDMPYHRALKGVGNQRIREFVEEGGKFLGICAGAYYGSASIQFEPGGSLEVIAARELQFFPGTARGPAYGLGEFRYRSLQGAKMARLHCGSPSCSAASYYNGGCAFVEPERHEGVGVLARYSDIEGQPAALVHCPVGEGAAILCGVHPEYSAAFPSLQEHLSASLLSALHAIEAERRMLFRLVLQKLGVV